MKIVRFESFMANAGLRNYLFLRLTTDSGLSGVGEASLEWQEQAVANLASEWVQPRLLGRDPFDIEDIVGCLIRDQYQGGSTVMTAISGIEIALWDIIGKACGQPLYKLLGGRCRASIPAYANGWYGGAGDPREVAQRAREVVSRGYTALKFDPFGTAWKYITPAQSAAALEMVAAVREAVGSGVALLIEFHGRLSATDAISMMHALARYEPSWCEEPVAPECLDLLAEVRRRAPGRIAAGERLYTQADFFRLIASRAVDVVQMDIAHCGGLLAAKKIAAMAAAQDIEVSPHCSIGPVALAAALHFDASTPNVQIQEAFGEFDVPWRNALVGGFDPLSNGRFTLTDQPGLGLELDESVIADHPYQPGTFPSLWDKGWLTHFTQRSGQRG